MSPEIIKSKKYDAKVDIWSSGIITYILLSGLVPFGGEDTESTYQAILMDDLQFPEDPWENISSTA